MKMLVHIFDNLVRIQRQNNPRVQPGLLPQGITPLAQFKVWNVMVWYGMEWCGVVWCGVAWSGVVWSGLLKKDLALLIKISFTYKKQLQKLDTF